MNATSRTVLERLGALYRAGRHAELAQHCQELLQADPSRGGIWKVLGVALAAQGKHADALQAKEQAARLLPDDAEAHANLGNARCALGQPALGEAAYRRALSLDDRFVSAWAGLGRLARSDGRLDLAQRCLEKVVTLAPAVAENHNELGNLLRERGAVPESLARYQQAVALRPDLAEAWSNLGNTLADLGQATQALEAYDRALQLLPGRGEIHSNRGNLLKDLGRLPEALADYRQAVALAPDFLGGHSNLLLALNHDPSMTPAQTLTAARDFGARAAERANAALALPAASHHFSNPLRVGFVSGDLRNHPVGYFLEALLAHLDRDAFVLLGYPTINAADHTTARLRQHFTHWHSLADLDDAAAARLIAGQRPDILIDLSGHTAHNRLGVFAWRPAPLQVSWLGYFATTGLQAMDWLLADRSSVPPAAFADFTERIAWLEPTRLCFMPPAQAPEVAPAPVLQRGHLSLGSVQPLGKITDAVLDLWSRVLRALPDATLRLQTPLLADPAVQDALAGRLAQRGVERHRLRMHGKTSRRAYLQAYSEVDLMLDTFPYPGGTTTCEALWMGVPTLTLRGRTLLGRQGAALLEAAGLPQWVADSPDDFVDKAIAASARANDLARERAGLRARVAASPLFDGPAFAHEFARVLRSLVASVQQPAQQP